MPGGWPETLGIPHSVFDVEEEFTRDVIDDFVSEYADGRTPESLRPMQLLHEVRRPAEAGSGNGGRRHRHRALRSDRLEDLHHGPALLRGADAEKDQAYFLWGLPKGRPPLPPFPLGRIDQGPGPGTRPGPGPDHGRQTRIPGDLFRAHRGLPGPPTDPVGACPPGLPARDHRHH